jgi:biopolymer transport protein TolQ
MVSIKWGNSLWQLVACSDALTKVILFILLLMSILCWAVFLYKLVLINVKKKQINSALKLIKSGETFEDLRTKVSSFSHTIAGYFLLKNLAFLKQILERMGGRVSLSEREVDLVDYNLNQTIDSIIAKEESYLPILYSCAAVSPLLGLLGTVWGIIYAFMSISERQSADLVTVAPGIAAALITTLAGLLVAIPAVMMYHYLSLQVKHLESQLIYISDRFMWLVHVVFFKQLTV